MRPLQRESREVVIELGLSPEVLQVTLATPRKLTVMIVIFNMTSRTFLTRAFQYTARAVARLTIGQQVDADEFHILMEISAIDRLPAVFRVTA